WAAVAVLETSAVDSTPMRAKVQLRRPVMTPRIFLGQLPPPWDVRHDVVAIGAPGRGVCTQAEPESRHSGASLHHLGHATPPEPPTLHRGPPPGYPDGVLIGGVVIGFLLGLILRGRPGNLLDARIRWSGLLFLA